LLWYDTCMQHAPTVVRAGSEYRREIIRSLSAVSRLLDHRQLTLTDDPDDREVSWAPELIRRATPGKGIGNTVARILLDAASRAEGVGAGSAEAILRLVVDLVPQLLKEIEAGGSPQEMLRELQNDSRGTQELIQVETRWPALKDLLLLVENLGENELDKELVKTAVQLAGLEGRIFVELTSAPRSSVELSLDHTFELPPLLEVVKPDEMWQYSNVRVAIIDGIIESVSEIHKLLEAANSSKEPCVLFCRGFSEEVIATLGLNRRRGTLNVIPVPVTFDPEMANALKDIAVILGSDVVTSLQGQLISELKWDELTVAPEIRFQGGFASIRGAGNDSAVAAHLRDLLSRRGDLPPNARREIIDLRIRSLTTRSVGIRVGGPHRESIAQRADLLLRSIRSSVAYGVVDSQRLLVDSEVTSPFRKSFLSAISTSDFIGPRPAISLAAVVRFSREATTSLVNTEAAILLDL